VGSEMCTRDSLKGGCRSMSSALKKAWDRATDAMASYKHSFYTDSNYNDLTIDLCGFTKRS
jgi:hypothetical protein